MVYIECSNNFDILDSVTAKFRVNKTGSYSGILVLIVF
jgi:hypothetical protein